MINGISLMQASVYSQFFFIQSSECLVDVASIKLAEKFRAENIRERLLYSFVERHTEENLNGDTLKEKQSEQT